MKKDPRSLGYLSLLQELDQFVAVGSFGVYVADDCTYDYYLYQCTDSPKQAKQDTVFRCDGNEFAVKEGEWYCEGLWLEKVRGTVKWHYLTDQKCIVRMQIVIDADVQLLSWSEDNPFFSNLSRRIAEDAKEKGAMMITNEDHNFLMEVARQRTTLDFVDVVYGSVEGDDDGADLSDEDDEFEQEDFD